MKHAIFIIKGLEKNVIPTLHQDAFKKAGITWEFWGSKYLSRESSSITAPSPKYGDVEVKAVTRDMLDIKLTERKNTFFIFDYSLERKNIFFLKKLKQYGIPYIVIINKNSFLHKALFYTRKTGFKNSTIKMLSNIFYSRINRFINNHYSNIPKPELAILGTKNDNLGYNYPYPQKGLTYFHSDNYEKTLGLIHSISNNKTLVFIDQFLPWHPDTIAFDKWKMNPELYYNKIASFLNKLGSELNLKPIIAAHPKTTEKMIEPYLSGIPLIYGKTPELISSAALVVQHSSTTIEQAIILEKPLLLVMCNEVKNSPIEQSIKLFANNLKGTYINLEEYLLNDLNEGQINLYIINNKNQFRNYIHQHIKEPTTVNISLWEYIAQTLKNIKP